MDRVFESVRPQLEVRVSTVSIETGRSADATVVATGYLTSRQQARIGARATGRIEQVNVEEGSKVAANDVLAVLEHADLDASLAAENLYVTSCPGSSCLGTARGLLALPWPSLDPVSCT